MRALPGVFLVLAIGGCAVSPAVELVVIPRAEAPTPPFAECLADEYLYVGENSLAALGLVTVTAAPVDEADADRVGMIWVTADLLPQGTEMVRSFCVEFPDGSGISEWPVDVAWRPPGFVTETTEDAAGLPPSALLLMAVTALLLVGVSLIAFRGRK